ncbi:MAG: nucleotide exchange factor GrpE [Methanomicrobiales archaeon]|nr:nucleotide exchange factor GrpE [Methanomicrobiales archaeon]MDI6876363.1 nucleotide exchange factor GrpE [Methanomicrobiales archaeon]
MQNQSTERGNAKASQGAAEGDIDLQSALEEERKRYAELQDRYIRLAADFDNYRKKFDRERDAIVSLANQNLIAELLVIVDDFERALASIESEENREGLEMLQKNFLKILESHGLQAIECLGKKFDPNLHDVLAQEASECESGTVLEEYQKGYMLRSRVIRPSKVKIAEDSRDRKGEHHE